MPRMSTARVTDNKFGKAERAITDAAEKALKISTFAIEAMAKMRAPVDTGFLRSSIQSRFPVPGTGIVSASAEYAVYVEFGTRYATKQPFMIPAFETVKPKFIRQLKMIGRGLSI